MTVQYNLLLAGCNSSVQVVNVGLRDHSKIQWGEVPESSPFRWISYNGDISLTQVPRPNGAPRSYP